jgi:hypothetical protein
VDRVRGPDGRIGLLGNNDLNELIGEPGVPLVQLTSEFLKRTSLPVVTSYPCLINQISDADRNRRTLEHLDRMLSGYRGRIVNRPSEVLKTSRDRMAKTLAGTPGLRVPKVARLRGPDQVESKIEEAGLAFPIIVRRTGTHGGKIVGLFDSMDDLRREAPPDEDLFATEYADYRSADGLYRKYRVCMLGGSIILRHMIASDGWNVHGRDRRRVMLGRPDLRDEERGLLQKRAQAFSKSVVEALSEIRKRVSLDYFGVDFGIDADGALVLFEANATMEYHSPIADPEFAYGRKVLPALRRAALAMIPELMPIVGAKVRGSAAVSA